MTYFIPYALLVTSFPFLVAAEINTEIHLNVYFWTFFCIMFLPEFSIIAFKGFREWLRRGIEDGDEVLNTKDLKDLMVHYIALWCIRIFAIASLWTIWFNKDIPASISYTSIGAALSIYGFNVVGKKFLEK